MDFFWVRGGGAGLESDDGSSPASSAATQTRGPGSVFGLAFEDAAARRPGDPGALFDAGTQKVLSDSSRRAGVVEHLRPEVFFDRGFGGALPPVPRAVWREGVRKRPGRVPIWAAGRGAKLLEGVDSANPIPLFK